MALGLLPLCSGVEFLVSTISKSFNKKDNEKELLENNKAATNNT
jgi:hypothetical protein